MSTDSMIVCPVCNGTKLSPYGKRNPCMCCDGAGEITERKQAAIKAIRADLAAKMKERGIKV